MLPIRQHLSDKYVRVPPSYSMDKYNCFSAKTLTSRSEPDDIYQNERLCFTPQSSVPIQAKPWVSTQVSSYGGKPHIPALIPTPRPYK